MFRPIGRANIKDIVVAVSELTDEDWNKWKDLQTLYNSHDSTLAYALFWSMPSNDTQYKVVLHDTTSKLAVACETLINGLTKTYEARPIAAAFSLLRERRVIPIHTDNEYANIHRLHIPIVTNESVYIFGRDFRLRNMRQGIIYQLDATKPHGIVNGSRINRVHLVIDIPYGPAIKEIVYETPGSDI